MSNENEEIDKNIIRGYSQPLSLDDLRQRIVNKKDKVKTNSDV